MVTWPEGEAAGRSGRGHADCRSKRGGQHHDSSDVSLNYGRWGISIHLNNIPGTYLIVLIVIPRIPGYRQKYGQIGAPVVPWPPWPAGGGWLFDAGRFPKKNRRCRAGRHQIPVHDLPQPRRPTLIKILPWALQLGTCNEGTRLDTDDDTDNGNIRANLTNAPPPGLRALAEPSPIPLYLLQPLPFVQSRRIAHFQVRVTFPSPTPKNHNSSTATSPAPRISRCQPLPRRLPVLRSARGAATSLKMLWDKVVVEDEDGEAKERKNDVQTFFPQPDRSLLPTCPGPYTCRAPSSSPPMHHT